MKQYKINRIVIDYLYLACDQPGFMPSLWFKPSELDGLIVISIQKH